MAPGLQAAGGRDPGEFEVVVSAAGRFHAFELAKQLESRGYLRCLYTGYPIHKVYEVNHARVRTHPALCVANRLVQRRSPKLIARPLNRLMTVDYDRWVARSLCSGDVIVSLSSFAVETFREARRREMVTICDRGSSHIGYQAEVLREEHRRFGIAADPMDDRIIVRELTEYEEADYISVPSTFVWRTFVDRGIPEHKLLKIPYGVDLSVYRPLRKRDDVFRVLFVGTASLRKGVQYLLEAVAPLHLPNFEVTFVGAVDSCVRPILDRYSHAFKHIGFVPRLELADVYSQASVLVLPSLEEGLALVQAQAMACGVPVIATPNTGCEDLFTPEAEGLAVPPRDVSALRSAIVRLYEDRELRQRLAARALARVRALGGWDAYGETAVWAYGRALLERGRALGPGPYSQIPAGSKRRVAKARRG